MAYRYAGFGGASDTQSPVSTVMTEDPKYGDGTAVDPHHVPVVSAAEADYTTGLPPKPGDVVALPTPADLPAGPTPSGTQVLKPSTTSVPATPTLPSMTTTTQSGFISRDGLFGVSWRWWILGGIVVAVFRATTRESKVAANKRRRRRRSR